MCDFSRFFLNGEKKPPAASCKRSSNGARGETRTLTLIRRRILNPLRLPFRHPGYSDFEKPPATGAGGLNSGVGDGTRTHDNRNHNPGLYQLSYTHHIFVPVRLACPAGFEPATLGVKRFELPTSCSQSRRATGLRYTPRESRIIRKLLCLANFFEKIS